MDEVEQDLRGLRPALVSVEVNQWLICASCLSCPDISNPQAWIIQNPNECVAPMDLNLFENSDTYEINESSKPSEISELIEICEPKSI